MSNLVAALRDAAGRLQRASEHVAKALKELDELDPTGKSIGARDPTAIPDIPERGQGAAEGPAPTIHLPPREREVFLYLGQGLSQKEIARKMNVSPKTVDAVQQKLRKKLGAATMAELRRQAVLDTNNGGS